MRKNPEDGKKDVSIEVDTWAIIDDLVNMREKDKGLTKEKYKPNKLQASANIKNDAISTINKSNVPTGPNELTTFRGYDIITSKETSTLRTNFEKKDVNISYDNNVPQRFESSATTPNVFLDTIPTNHLIYKIDKEIEFKKQFYKDELEQQRTQSLLKRQEEMNKITVYSMEPSKTLNSCFRESKTGMSFRNIKKFSDGSRHYHNETNSK